jgi:DNA-directed RNA polymerase specialized sigma subunit
LGKASSRRGLPDEAARREAEREAGQLRDRLLVNYSPLVKYVAGRVGARMQGAIEQEDMISYFYEGRTLKEIGKALGLTACHYPNLH